METKAINTFLCDYIYTFMQVRIDKVKPYSIFKTDNIWIDYGYENEKDFLNKVKNNIYDAMWTFCEMMTHCMDQNYTDSYLVSMSDTHFNHEVFKIGDYYFYIGSDFMPIEVKPTIKTIEIPTFEEI